MTSDEAPFSDPPVSHVLFGKGKVARATNAVGAHQDVDGEGEECLFINFTVKLKPGQTRYLLCFLEMNDTRQSALSSVRKFNRKRLSNPLKAGIKRGVQKKILNWDLVK